MSISRSVELPRVFAEDVEEDDRVPRAPVQDPVELTPVVAAKLAQLSFDLRRVRERQVRIRRREHVESVDLEVDRGLPIRIESLDEIVDWLGAVGCSVEDRLKSRHVPGQ
jgi:hypothetical protein